MEKKYYEIDIEIALHTSEYMFGFINISHISYEKFYELFNNQLTDEKFLFDDSRSYFFDKELYMQHKNFIDKEISIRFDFSLFQYSISLGSIEAASYKKDYYETLPSWWQGNIDKGMKKPIYQIELLVNKPKDKNVFASVNISNISYEKFYELFNNQLTDEEFLFNKSKNYIITEELYNEHKLFLEKQIAFNFDFSLFEYRVGFKVIEKEHYRKNYYEELPTWWRGW